MGGLLERVGEADQLGLAECGPGKRRAKGRRQRAEARWHGRRIGEEAGRHDHARVPRARRRVGAEVRWEKGCVELLARGAYRNGNDVRDRKSTRLNSSHLGISYAVFCLKKKNNRCTRLITTNSHNITAVIH